MVRLRQVPQTTDEAKVILDAARSLQQERLYQKVAAEHAAHQCDLQLQYFLQCGSDEDAQARNRSNRQHLQQDISEATRRLDRAYQDLSTVRQLIERAGYPMMFPIETHPPRFPTNLDHLGDDNDSSSSCWSV
jgi:hypothetical protein